MAAQTTWTRVSALMMDALDVPTVERRAWVEAHTSGEPAIAAEVLRLLDADAGAGGFLDRPILLQPGAAAALQAALPASAPVGLLEDSHLGPYRIVRELGQGGMGRVYLALRADDAFEKYVAIKVVPGALVSDLLREHFARERQLLAALDHPGIARVLDGGATPEGLPYLVMEYVDGTAIDQYCDAHHFDAAARLRLAVDVSRAVQYAHEHGIIHRDIKAANVLVGEDGRPRLLDFGIGKLLAGDSTKDGATRVRAWTPETASPEQVTGEPTTMATDVYGLGGLLYRLLTGRPVFELGDLNALERARMVCEQMPEPPSTATGGSTVTASLGRSAAADLDAVVLKALHKEPGRRYRSAEHLAEDLERWLAHRPVLAAPDTWRYRTGKFVGRHPVATMATAAALLAVAGATTAALWQARVAELERSRTQARLTDVRRLANSLIFELYDRVGNAPDATPLRRSLVQQGLAYLDRIAADAEADAEVRLELAGAYERLALVQGAGESNLGDRAAATASLEKARTLLAPLRAGSERPLEVELADVRMVRLLTRTVDQPRAQGLAAEAVARATGLERRYPGHTEVLGAVANAYFYAAIVSAPPDKLQLWTQANRAFGELSARTPDSPELLRSVALTEKYIGASHHAGNLDLASIHYQRALELDRQVQALRPNNRQTTIDLGIDLGNMAAVRMAASPPDLVRAGALYEESLALRQKAVDSDPQDVYARQALGYCLMQLSNIARERGQADRAVAFGRRAADVYEALPHDTNVERRGEAWLALARAQRDAARPAAACSAFRRADNNFRQATASTSPDRANWSAEAGRIVAAALAACP